MIEDILNNEFSSDYEQNILEEYYINYEPILRTPPHKLEINIEPNGKSFIPQTQNQNSSNASLNTFNTSNENLFKSLNKSSENKKVKKEKNGKRGRKIKDSKDKGVHGKSTDDNIIEKVKHSVLDNFRKHFNRLLKKHNIGRSLCKIYKGKKREKMNYNKILIYKKLKDIFSAKISPKYKHYSKDNNIKLIKEILNDKDENKNTLKQILNFTFLDCLKHFKNEKPLKELDGMTQLEKCVETMKEKYKEDDEYELYSEKFKEFVYNFEKIINDKKGRNRKKN